MFKKLSILMILPLFLFGCSKNEYNPEQLQKYYAKLTAVTANVDIKTNSGVLLSYALTCEKSEQLSKTTVTAPEALAGITATIEDKGAKIAYDSVMLETLLPSLQGFAPIDAFDGVISDLKGGVPNDTLIDGEGVALSYAKSFDGYECEKIVYVNRETMELLRAEFFINGTLVMELEVSLFNPV